jgi:hypothetical protein
MKAGLVMNAFIARAFHEIGGSAFPIRLLLTGDEEMVSPSSRPIIQQRARRAAGVSTSKPAGQTAMSSLLAEMRDCRARRLRSFPSSNCHDQGRKHLNWDIRPFGRITENTSHRSA